MDVALSHSISGDFENISRKLIQPIMSLHWKQQKYCKKIKDNLNKQRDTLCLCVRRLNVFKTLRPFELIYKVNTIQSQSQQACKQNRNCEANSLIYTKI